MRRFMAQECLRARNVANSVSQLVGSTKSELLGAPTDTGSNECKDRQDANRIYEHCLVNSVVGSAVTMSVLDIHCIVSI